MSRLLDGLERLGRRGAYKNTLRTTGNEAWADMDANCLGPKEARRHGLVEAAKRTALVAIALASVAITATPDTAGTPPPDTTSTPAPQPTPVPMPQIELHIGGPDPNQTPVNV